jgi:glycosyltransferase involved in cell wall biosynthesis
MGDPPVTAVRASARRTFAVLLTFRRPDDLDRSLGAISTQSTSFDELVIVDNDPGERSVAILERHRSALGPTTYVGSPTNLGPAGGRSLGASEIMLRADDDDWIVFLDDDDPLPSPDLVERLITTADHLLEIDPATAGVGLRGARLDRWTGRLVPVGGRGVHRVDHLHGNCVPAYRVGSLQRVGPFDARLFFGFEELELGLRLRRAGMTLYSDGDLYATAGSGLGEPQPRPTPSLRLDPPSLRRYYALRNRLVVLGRERLIPQAIGWALVAGLLKPIAWLLAHPSAAWGHLRLNLAAIRDASAGRLGPRTWVDEAGVAHP